MTTVHISLGRDDGTGQTAAKGVVEWEPTTRREDGTMVILERGFVAPLVDGEATVVVDPSGLTWCWRVTERTDSGGTVRYVSVPDSAAVVEYVDLPDVDPTTLEEWSPADPEAAYLARLAAVELSDLADVDLTGLADGDVPVWDETAGKWQPGAGGGAVTSVDGQTGDVSLSSTYVAQADPEAVAGLAPITDGAGGYSWEPGGGGGGTTDHGLLNGLLDDDHTQYALADGTRGMFAATSHTHPASQISDSTVTGRALITAATATAARTAISAAPALGSDDNYVTDAEKAALHSHANKSALDQVSGINTGDQVLPTWSTIDGKPAVVAAGATQADARAAIGAGTSSLVIGTTAGTAKAGDYAPDLSGLAPIAQPRNAQTGTAYTLVASDAGKLVTLDNAAAITVTVPASTITVPADTVVRVDFLVLGTGLPTFVGSGGMTINADPSLVADAQYAGLSLLLLSATSGVLVGRLATP